MKQRKARIQTLIDAFRHRGIGEDEVYAEIAEWLMDDHAYNRFFHDAFGSDQLDEVEQARLKAFYEDFREGAYALADER